MELRPPAVTVPERLDGPGLERLAGALRSVERGPVLLRGGGDGTFSDGLDLEAAVAGPEAAGHGFDAFVDVLRALCHSPFPTVAVVDGNARGGGVGLVAACDRVIATDRARFALPELLFGLLPGTIWPVLIERMRPSDARAWALDGMARSAAEAQAAGLVDRVVAAAELERVVAAEARALGRARGEAVVALRRWAGRARSLPLDEALAEGARLATGRLADRSVREGLRRYLEEGRAPWTR